MRFTTEYIYKDRETKALYVWKKYQQILKGNILDVGADQCYLKEYLNSDTEYIGIGLGEGPDLILDLEKEKIPYSDCSFDCVVCLDVLEHLDNFHEVFDELCRVAKHYVIISLPNPLGNLFGRLLYGDYRPGQFMKFYGLPLDPPEDRHKWFFSNEEAKKFIDYRSVKNNMRILQLDTEGDGLRPPYWKRIVFSLIFQSELNWTNLYSGSMWAVLKKIEYLPQTS